MQHAEIEVASGDIERMWPEVQKVLRARLGDDVWDSGIKSLHMEGVEGAQAFLTVPTPFLAVRIRTHYREQILDAIRSHWAGTTAVQISVRDRAPRTPVQTNPPATLAQAPVPVVDEPRCSLLDPRYALDAFFPGEHSLEAYRAVIQLAERGSAPDGPLLIRAKSGHGKTHLAHVLVRAAAPGTKIVFWTACHFLESFGNASKSAFRTAAWLAEALVVVDDIDKIFEAQNRAAEEALAWLLEEKKLGAATTTSALSDLPMREDVRRLLRSGAILVIDELDMSVRREILAREVRDRFVGIDPESRMTAGVREAIVERCKDGHELVRLISRLAVDLRSTDEPPSPEGVLRLIRQESGRVPIEEILRVVSRHFGISKGDLLSRKRHRSVVQPRQVAMYLAKQLTGRSLPEIGRLIGGRDHTTVLHAIGRVEYRMTGEVKLRDEIEQLKRLVRK